MINGIYNDFKGAIDSSVKFLRGDLSKLRTGRANLAILDDVRVDYYGTPTPINQVASMAVSDARLITIKPWDRSVISLIEKAIWKWRHLFCNPFLVVHRHVRSSHTTIRLT